jgi:hypothetical protein
MTNEEIIEMAKQVGMLQINGGYDIWIPECIEDFAKLIAEKEREACAKICDDMDSISDYYTLRVELICAQAIRARGQE